MTAFLSFKVLDSNVNVSPVFTFDEKYVTIDITAATKGDHYLISALETIHQLSQLQQADTFADRLLLTDYWRIKLGQAVANHFVGESRNRGILGPASKPI